MFVGRTLRAMTSLGRSVFVGILLWVTVCNSQPDRPPSENIREDGMRSVVNTVTITGHNGTQQP
jgi:hypothetical protein